ncbi:MAG: diaminopropionate ammonia-lyase [Calditrichaeota bacterium]|nr:diaminopropionate ammonia-lyase [Calditrichota bacterium]
MCQFAFNPYRKETPHWGEAYAFLNATDVWDFHRSLPGYAPTPVVELPRIARELGLGAVFVKDESRRFGIKAFKALGASYAIYRFLKQKWEEKFSTPFTPELFKDPAALRKLGTFTFAAATDGNHGRAVAWTARNLRQKAVIYMPADSAPARVKAIESEGARVVLVDGTFDDCVERCARDAEENDWQVVSDTAYPGYMDLPRFILLGYTTLFREMEDSLHPPGSPEIDFVLLPAGVGGLAAAGTSYYVRRYGKNRPTLICVEPESAACFLDSVRFGHGEAVATTGALDSIMAGLNCGVPSPVTWPIIRDGMDFFLAIPDHYAEQAMRLYAREGVVSGESGASGLAGLLALTTSPALQEAVRQLGLGPDSRVLLINTEGDTDPESYRRIVSIGIEHY